MTDKVLTLTDTPTQTPIPIKYHDNGDGTYSPVIELSTSPTIDIGKVDQGTPGASAWLVSLSTLPFGTVGGTTIVVGDETTRLGGGDTTIYAAGDAISVDVNTTAVTALRSLAVARVAGGSGYLTGFRLMTNVAANTERIRAHFYTLAQPTGAVVGDNVPMTLLYLNKACRIGHVDFPAFSTSTVVGSSTGAYAWDTTTRLPFQCAGGNTNIYYRLETLDIFTPVSAQLFYLQLSCENN